MLSFSSREFVELVPPDGARGREREDGGGGFRGLGGSGGRGRKGRKLLFSFFTVCVLWGRRGGGTLFSRWAAAALFSFSSSFNLLLLGRGGRYKRRLF